MFVDDNPFLSRLTAEEADSCEGKLTLHECLKALKSMALGLMAILQFYMFLERHWPIPCKVTKLFIRTWYLICYTKTWHAIITCLPKPGKPKDKLKSWRPITLLYLDLKTASAAIANRVKGHLNKLISESQKGYPVCRK
jgi:hypothetical protein